jgi:alkylation response protein AidB-like acyl-CoA dehydrogenase
MIDIDRLITQKLRPRVTAIDLNGEYPEEFLRCLGNLGGFAGVVSREFGGSGHGLSHSIDVMDRIGRVCLSTAFIAWCQTACARYVQLSNNAALKAELLPELAEGRRFGGTGLSNTFKSCSEIERFLLSARRVSGGYEVNGNLPWVSNLGEGHVFVTACPVERDGRLVFFAVSCAQDGFRLVDGAHFTALEGTRTLACQFRDCRIDDRYVLAHPEESEAYLARIKPGMILAQMGMALGLVSGCIELIESASRTHGHVNRYLDDQAEDLRELLAAAYRETHRLGGILDADPYAPVLPDVLRVRLTGSELSLRAAQAAMLHQGARGYLQNSAAQRRLREAYFVAIVTPAIKHLRRELARFSRGQDTVGSIHPSLGVRLN